MNVISLARTVADDDGTRVRRGLACGLVAAVIWGGFLAVSRQGIGAGLEAADLAFLRYATAGLLLLPWLVRRSPHRLAGIGWRKGLALAMLAGPPFVLAGASGYHFAPLAHGAVIQLGMLTLMSILLAALLVGERPSLRRLAGIGVLIIGLVVTAGPSLLQGSSTAWIGDLLFALAGSMWALFTVLQRRWSVPPLAATAIVSVLSGAIFSPLYLAHEGLAFLDKASTTLIAEQILVQGVLSGVVALFAFSQAVQNLGPARATLFPALAPAVAILLGIPLAGEIPTGLQIVGLAILTLGLVIAVRGGAAASRSNQA
ncbi:DMT family transporter [Pseudochelatococcus sp. B33]